MVKVIKYLHLRRDIMNNVLFCNACFPTKKIRQLTSSEIW